MAEKYSVVFSGRLREGETPDAVKLRLAELFRVRPEQLEAFFLKAPSVLRRGLDETVAAKWVAAIERAGALCWAEPEVADANPASTPASTPLIAPVVHSAEPPGEPAAAPAPSASGVLPLAAPVTPAHRSQKDKEVVPFPKCPKCGRLAESTEDHLMRTGVCPRCGLIIQKYAGNFVVAEEGFWNRVDPVIEGDRHWAAFWQSRLWPSFWRAAWYLCCALVTVPALLRVFEVHTDEATGPTMVQMGVSGILLAVSALVIAVASFYCFSLYRSSHPVFLTHVLWSAGVCAALAVVGGLLSFIGEGVGSIARALGLGRVMNPVRAGGLAAAVFFSIVLYFGFVRLPAEQHLWEYLDGPEYSATVKEAVSLAGSDFPKGSRGDKYRYYRYVYVEPARAVDPEFERVLMRLLPDFSPNAYARQHGTEVNLLVFNAFAFRDELVADRIISDEMRLRLDQMAAEWEQSRQHTAAQLVRVFDTRSPIDPKDLHLPADRN